MPTNIQVSATLSPDGRTLAIFRSGHGKTVATVSVDGTGYHELYADPSAGGFVLGHICWTNDGHSLLFVMAGGGTNQIMRISAAGGAPEPVGPKESFLRVRALTVSPDGSRLAYETVTAGATHDIFALDLSAWLKGSR